MRSHEERSCHDIFQRAYPRPVIHIRGKKSDALMAGYL